MKKLLTLIALSILFVGCKKKDDTVAIDMTLKTYSVQVPHRSLSVILELKFKNDGTVSLREFPTNEIVNLSYEIGDKMASKTTLRIYGEMDKSFYPEGFSKGTKIDWNTSIARPGYNEEIIGFTVDKFHFSSQ